MMCNRAHINKITSKDFITKSLGKGLNIGMRIEPDASFD